MAPQRNNEQQPGHTGTIPKSKVRNNCNVPQEAVTPTRRDMSSNIVSTSLDWVPVSEYNQRSNYNQSRKQTNNLSDQELADFENSASYEGGFGRFVPVRPQPRALPLNIQNRDNLSIHNEEVSSVSGYSLNAYPNSVPNGLTAHSNHAAAAVMIVNPTTPNAVAGMPLQVNSASSSRINLTRNFNQSRNHFEGSHSTSSNTPPIVNSRAAKTVNLMNNMYEGQSASASNLNDSGHTPRESARALGDALVSSCPDASAVERRLSQIREYIRVTSSLVDTMRNSEDEAFIQHTKEEYDELVEMVMKLKESENKLQQILVIKEPDNIEVPEEETLETNNGESKEINNSDETVIIEVVEENNNDDKEDKQNISTSTEQVSPAIINSPVEDFIDIVLKKEDDTLLADNTNQEEDDKEVKVEIDKAEDSKNVEKDINLKDNLNEMLRRNIMSCVEKVALMEDLRKKTPSVDQQSQEMVLRPLSVQSNTSVFSENDIWQNDVRNVMDYSQQRLPSGNQHQRRQHKHQQEDAHLMEELNRGRSLDMQPSTSHDNFSVPQYRQHHQSNQVGIATTLPHSEAIESQSNSAYANEQEHRYMQNEAAGGSLAAGRNSDEDEDTLNDRRRDLTHKLRELQMKKQHMENLVSEFQKIQMASGTDSLHNTYSSTGEESGDEEPVRKGGNQTAYNKNEDNFKLMEIKAIKAALEKTKDLMRRVENCEENMSNANDDSFQMTNHSNLHDNKSEGGASTSGWSNDGSVCRVRNSLQQRHKFTNERHSQNQNHEANIASLQDLAQELRMETEKIMGERARLKDIVSNKETCRKQKKTNEPPVPGPAERRQMELRALLAEKQKELEALLNKEKVLSSEVEAQKVNLAASVANQSYNSEIEESRSENLHQESQNSREENIRVSSDRMLAARMNAMSSHLGSVYASDSDSTSRVKSNQRNRGRRRTVIERQIDDSNTPQSNVSQNPRLDSLEGPNVNLVPPLAQADNGGNMPYANIPPPNWNNLKSNQDMRANQFTQNSHSQTMDRLLSTPQMTSFPPTLPFNMMIPYGMAGACGCGCAVWASWCCQQMALQQREIMQLREQMAHLEERWRTENASHTLNNQVPPGNRANNYWDNFRSYSRQNLLSANSKANMEAHLSFGANASHMPHPLVDRSHNTLRPRQSSASLAKRNVDATRQQAQTQTHTQQRSLSLCSAPEELNGSQEDNSRRRRDINIARSIPEGNSHSHNINSTPDNNHNNKSRSKLTTKTSGLRACAPAETTTTQIAHSNNVESADSYEANAQPRETLRIVDLLKENIYSEVSNLIGINESHPDYLLQLFKELQQVSSDALRQNVLHSIRTVLARSNTTVENHIGDANASVDESSEAVSATNGSHTTADITLGHENISRNANSSVGNTYALYLLMKSEDIITQEFANALISHVNADGRNRLSKKRLRDALSKYEGSRVSDVFDEILENISRLTEDNYDSDTQQSGEMSESPHLQDVAGSLNLFSSSDSQLHQINVCPYEMWPEHVHMDASVSDHSRSQEGKSDLINCSEMHNGDLAEADQTCHSDTLDVTSQVDDRPNHSDALPDVVDANESTPTEAEAEWLGLDRIPTRLHTDEPSEKQKD